MEERRSLCNNRRGKARKNIVERQKVTYHGTATELTVKAVGGIERREIIARTGGFPLYICHGMGTMHRTYIRD